MTRDLEQSFPVPRDGGIEHRRWTVDLVTAHRRQDLGDRDGRRLRREVEEMQQHLPRWILTVAEQSSRVLCGHCQGPLVFDRGLRCVLCDRTVPFKRQKRSWSLAWFGLLPPIGIDGLAKLRRALQRKAPPQHLVGEQAGIGKYLLVPLTAVYPDGFPRRQVKVAYLPGFFEIPGIPKRGMSHSYHMLDKGFMCLFAAGQWRPEMSCREVLQQRAYAHVIKFLNYGNGKRQAFARVS